MTHDHAYLSQLPEQDLLDRAHRGAWTGPEAHMIRALADRLEEHLDALADYDALNDALMDANQRAESWRDEAQALQRRADGWKEEAQALQRQLDMVRG